MDFLSFIFGLWTGAAIATLAIMFVRSGRGSSLAREEGAAAEAATAATPVAGRSTLAPR